MRALRFVCLSAVTLTVASTARAYRPFDGTDADTAEYKHFELELGPAHWYQQGKDKYVLAPATVLNYGIGPGTELVIDFKDFVAVGPLEGRPRVAFLDTDLLVKHVFREGALQNKSGLSIAAEGGVLSPEWHGTSGVGASLDVIFSYRWSWGTLHFNEQPAYSREHDLDFFSSVIAEGPHEWKVRPVAEAYYERELHVAETWSILAGGIWTLRDSFVLDLAGRLARVGDQDALEVRLGFTWSIPLGESEGEDDKTENAARRQGGPMIARSLFGR